MKGACRRAGQGKDQPALCKVLCRQLLPGYHDSNRKDSLDAPVLLLLEQQGSKLQQWKIRLKYSAITVALQVYAFRGIMKLTSWCEQQ